MFHLKSLCKNLSIYTLSMVKIQKPSEQPIYSFFLFNRQIRCVFRGGQGFTSPRPEGGREKKLRFSLHKKNRNCSLQSIQLTQLFFDRPTVNVIPPPGPPPQPSRTMVGFKQFKILYIYLLFLIFIVFLQYLGKHKKKKKKQWTVH